MEHKVNLRPIRHSVEYIVRISKPSKEIFKELKFNHKALALKYRNALMATYRGSETVVKFFIIREGAYVVEG